jgi:hypothetical protein
MVFIFLYSNTQLDTPVGSALAFIIPTAFIAQFLFLSFETLTEWVKKVRGQSVAGWEGILGLALLTVSTAIIAIALNISLYIPLN